MMLEALTIGTVVVFNPKVFDRPYSPYYDEYKNHTFEVVDYMYEGKEVIDDHLLIKCIDDPSVIVGPYIHDDELLRLSDVPNHVKKLQRHIQVLSKFA